MGIRITAATMTLTGPPTDSTDHPAATVPVPSPGPRDDTTQGGDQ